MNLMYYIHICKNTSLTTDDVSDTIDSLKHINLQIMQGTNRHAKLINMLYILLSSKSPMAFLFGVVTPIVSDL